MIYTTEQWITVTYDKLTVLQSGSLTLSEILWYFPHIEVEII